LSPVALVDSASNLRHQLHRHRRLGRVACEADEAQIGESLRPSRRAQYLRTGLVPRPARFESYALLRRAGVDFIDSASGLNRIRSISPPQGDQRDPQDDLADVLAPSHPTYRLVGGRPGKVPQRRVRRLPRRAQVGSESKRPTVRGICPTTSSNGACSWVEKWLTALDAVKTRERNRR